MYFGSSAKQALNYRSMSAKLALQITQFIMRYTTMTAVAAAAGAAGPAVSSMSLAAVLLLLLFVFDGVLTV